MRDGLPLPVGERAGVATAACPGRHRGATSLRRDLRGGAGAHSDAGAPLAGQAQLGALADGHRHARRREAAAREVDLDPRRPYPVSPRATPSSGPGQRQVGGVRQVARVRKTVLEERRLEQARELTSHDLGGGDGCEVGRSLSVTPGAERLTKAEQHQHTDQHRGEHPKHQQRGLAALAVSIGASRFARRHGPAPSLASSYSSTRPSNKSDARVTFNGPAQ